MLTRSQSPKLYIRIATTIRTMIEDGVYQPGDRLPPLVELAKQQGCSRATVREALSTLRGQGLIEFRHGDGTYVKTALVDLWMEPLDAALLLGVGQVRELVELQTAILAAIASRLAEGEDAIAIPLGPALFQLECALPNTEESIATELSFYLKMAECAGNPLLENIIRVMQESYRSCLRLQSGGELLGLETCRAVFDAIVRHRSDLAREVMYTYGRAITRRLEMERTGNQKVIPIAMPMPMPMPIQKSNFGSTGSSASSDSTKLR